MTALNTILTTPATDTWQCAAAVGLPTKTTQRLTMILSTQAAVARHERRFGNRGRLAGLL